MGLPSSTLVTVMLQLVPLTHLLPIPHEFHLSLGISWLLPFPLCWDRFTLKLWSLSFRAFYLHGIYSRPCSYSGLFIFCTVLFLFILWYFILFYEVPCNLYLPLPFCLGNPTFPLDWREAISIPALNKVRSSCRCCNSYVMPTIKAFTTPYFNCLFNYWSSC